jgi:hypothetical protein
VDEWDAELVRDAPSLEEYYAAKTRALGRLYSKMIDEWGATPELCAITDCYPPADDTEERRKQDKETIERWQSAQATERFSL